SPTPTLYLSRSPPPPRLPPFPYTTLFRSRDAGERCAEARRRRRPSSPGDLESREQRHQVLARRWRDRHEQQCRWRQREGGGPRRSEEHTSELQSPYDLVCRLLLEKKKKQ